MPIILMVLCCAPACSSVLVADEFSRDIRPLLGRYCVSCHGGSDPSADLDFEAIRSRQQVEEAYDVWEAAVSHVEARTMPPADEETLPSDEERQRFVDWFYDLRSSVTAKPARFKPRRLSVIEYRNTIKSVFGFDLRVNIMEAEQTLAEQSLVMKLMPTDPPGDSGFTNDTHKNALTAVAWDQYSYLADSALEELFSPARRELLASFCDSKIEAEFTADQAEALLRTLLPKIRRRPISEAAFKPIARRVEASPAESVKLELKAALLSPAFLYRGMLFESSFNGKPKASVSKTAKPGTDASGLPLNEQVQPVDDYELAERLSYFLWADMPDDKLFRLAAANKLGNDEELARQAARMLADPKARSLADVFATQWLHLNEIDHVSNNVPVMVALKSQPLDYMNHLFTAGRPLLELVDSKTAFVSPHTARHYGRDAKQMVKYRKQKGIEVEIVANQKIELKESTARGGLLTMPGILAMNRGPILRGTWMLESILGQPLPDPPPDVGQVEPNRGGAQLTFRQRFEQHRSKATCAVCHDKIDPLGFALQDYDGNGAFRGGSADTSGRLPSGETFEDFQELKTILTTTQRKAVLRNIVKRTLSYALCRKLSIYDQPVVDEITEQMDTTNGTWPQLFVAVVNSLPFRETILE